MSTVVVLLLLGVAFAGFAMLGPVERTRGCEHQRTGDPRCEHCSPEGERGKPTAPGAKEGP